MTFHANFGVTRINTVLKKKKETFRPKTGKIFFPIDVRQIFFGPLYYGRSFAVCPEVTYWENPGPVSGRKVSFFDNCSLGARAASINKFHYKVLP